MRLPVSGNIVRSTTFPQIRHMELTFNELVLQHAFQKSGSSYTIFFINQSNRAKRDSVLCRTPNITMPMVVVQALRVTQFLMDRPYSSQHGRLLPANITLYLERNKQS